MPLHPDTTKSHFDARTYKYNTHLIFSLTPDIGKGTVMQEAHNIHYRTMALRPTPLKEP